MLITRPRVTRDIERPLCHIDVHDLINMRVDKYKPEEPP
jgi:hypothetical protein